MSESTKNHAGQSDPQGADPRADWGWRERMLFSICLAPPAEVPQSRNPTAEVAPVYKPGERLTRFCRRIPGVTRETFTAKLVIDFGSGLGDLVMDLAGVARESIGLEIRPELNAIARERARAAGIENARFLLSEEFDFTRDKADYIISTDAMEHF
jgi:2-polyprenyl-3-methyl-5-hydroxy-6-metoxy-1,4-benzoquinol methylase